MKVLVLGCGPAGLMAAHAAALLHHDVIIVSRKRKSPMLGAQYLHQPIPLATSPDASFVIRYQLNGTVEEYRRKIYGNKPIKSVSPEDLVGSHMGWDIRQTYDWLWVTYSEYVKHAELGPDSVDDTVRWAGADKVISTIPANWLCDQSCSFGYEMVWIAPTALLPNIPDNFVICNGNDAPAWYRCSLIAGHGNTEWPWEFQPPIEGVRTVKKPLQSNCNCRPDIVRMGRYGRWEKGVLSHSAFYETLDLLEDRI